MSDVLRQGMKPTEFGDGRLGYRIWVAGVPESYRRGKSKKKGYIRRVQDAARAVVDTPLDSEELSVDIWFQAPYLERADVDNVAGPILDALQGIAYDTDRQVKSVRIACVSLDDRFDLDPAPWTDEEFHRLIAQDPPSFLVTIYDAPYYPGTMRWELSR